MYKQNISLITSTVTSIARSDGWNIPFAPDNTDYQQFKKDLAAGVELEDATGTVMTADQVAAFLATLP